MPAWFFRMACLSCFCMACCWRNSLSSELSCAFPGLERVLSVHKRERHTHQHQRKKRGKSNIKAGVINWNE